MSYQEARKYERITILFSDIALWLHLQLDRIRIGHDSQGPGKGVFLDDVEVTPDEEDPMYFPASCWLAEDLDDGKIEREIFAGTRAPQPSGTERTPYTKMAATREKTGAS